ncbi:MAG: transposase [Chlamydiae bacterium]|nr:transposase [Chlamydiota bacterium]MBI3265917.1 transposase [Chlamydiota bacterium]
MYLEFKIENRKGKVGSPYSNGKIERFFGTLKRELLNQFPKQTLTLKKVEKLLRDYKTYYNEHRPHQALDAGHPEEYYIYNKPIWVKPPKSSRNLPRKIRKIKFCEGNLNYYEAA